MAVYQDNEARVALNAPNTACTGRWGVCGIFKHFSGFEFPLLPNRIHACPLRLRHLPQIRLLKFGRDEGDGDRIWRRKGCGFVFFLLQNRVHVRSSATARRASSRTQAFGRLSYRSKISGVSQKYYEEKHPYNRDFYLDA